MISGPAIRSCVRTSGGVRSAATMKMITIAYLKNAIICLSSTRPRSARK